MVPDTTQLLGMPASADTREVEFLKALYNSQPEAPFLKAYIFGRRYKIQDFCNDMFDCLWEVVTKRYYTEVEGLQMELQTWDFDAVIYDPLEEHPGRTPRTSTSYTSSAGRTSIRNTSSTAHISTSHTLPRYSASGNTSSSARTSAGNASLAGHISDSYTLPSRYSSPAYTSRSVSSGYLSPYPALPHDRSIDNNNSNNDLPYPIMATNHTTCNGTNSANRSSIVRPLNSSNVAPRSTSFTVKIELREVDQKTMALKKSWTRLVTAKLSSFRT
ncbi:hypothetical protein HDK90DRAFT_471016 [Phyllosticta capitalensis]|uniref:Uncharacterized protein n=1 Tax=Phyllosticta capitalensis TaxID=121624 RepID=A0ABR1YAM5_9PEZI